jgi:hypothetical protein
MISIFGYAAFSITDVAWLPIDPERGSLTDVRK